MRDVKMEKTNIFEEYKANGLGIKKVEIDNEKLTIFWPDNREEIFYMKDLRKVAIITTDEGPFQPDLFWLMMFEFPIMVPSDETIPGSLAIADIMFELPNFHYEKFIEVIFSTSNNAFELWDRDFKITNINKN